LVERYSRLIYSIALKSGLDEDDSADVVQNVFTIVLRRLETLQQTERFSAWLITTSHRESWRVSRLRRAVPVPLSDDVPEPPDPAPDADTETLVTDWEQAALVHQALDRLGERCRRLIDALFLQDERASYESISETFGIALGSIGPIRARCLKQLRRHLDEMGVIGPDG
jgi:RNA polymerase sigma factor (sigma-70 family)